jgi:ribosome-associated toxin RatA of RatAB toxin-antitoxin module
MQLLLTLWMFICPVFAANPNTPHGHKGIATKFTNPAKATLSASEATTLSSGKAVLKQIQEGNGGRGVAIFDVSATPDQVWKVITSFENYPSYIDELSKVETYATKGNDLYVDFTISSWGFEVQYYIKHDYQPSKGYMTWTLDYSRESDLDDSTGYWLVYPSPLDPSKTRVEYSVDLRIKGWVPGFVQTMLAETGVENATKWVKREAEKL